MSNWHLGVLPIALFLIGAVAMACYTLMKHDSPKTTLFAGIGAFVITVVALLCLGMLSGVALLGGMVFGYVIVRVALVLFPPATRRKDPKAEDDGLPEPIAVIEPRPFWNAFGPARRKRYGSMGTRFLPQSAYNPDEEHHALNPARRFN
jgi:hypothetical protein